MCPDGRKRVSKPLKGLYSRPEKAEREGLYAGEPAGLAGEPPLIDYAQAPISMMQRSTFPSVRDRALFFF